MKILGCFKRLN